MTPHSAHTVTLASQRDDLSCFEFKDTEVPQSIGDHDVLVEVHAASLNYHDLVLAKGAMPLPFYPGIIPGSDGAGVVLKAGSAVQSFKPGDKVVTHMVPRDFDDASLYSLDDETLPQMGHINSGLGGKLNGTLTTHGVFHETCLVKFDGKMTYEEAATLPCSGITAWNSLMGLEGKKVKKGDWVLVQGSGGVSVAALQFAIAAGAQVVATTSSNEKGEKLRALGASHIINYRQTPQWGSAARDQTPSNRGFDIVLDVAGDATLAESLKAIRVGGLLVVAGLVGGSSEPVPLMSVLGTNCIVSGVLLGTRQMMRDMVAFVEEHGVKLALDDELFGLEDTQKAYQRLDQQKHFSKVIIQIPGKR